MPINVLDSNTINKIAAGEVVERPSSVVKELVENSIDAGATAITVEIKDGGISLIRITDNGCGINADEVKTAFLRHSTSKIKDAADLASISSLGFRGEALASISAVSQVELVTKTKDALSGIRYRINGGVEKSYEEVGAPDGTTFLVRNLFYNTPARRKFLKTPATEGGYISSVIEHLCLSHPEISFRFINNGQPKIQTTGNGNLKDVIYTVYGREITANLIQLKKEFENFTIDGFIGKPIIARGNRGCENYYINGRYIKSNIIAKAIEEAYAPFIMQHRYPFTAFHIMIEPKLLDVNVHPSKMELRFANGPFLFDSLKSTISYGLSHRELIPEFTIDNAKDISRPTPAAVKPQASAVKAEPVTMQKTVPDGPAVFVKSEPVSQTAEEVKNIIPKAQPVKTQSKQPGIPPVLPKAPAVLDKKPGRMPEPFETVRAASYVKENKPPVYEQLELFDRTEILNENNLKDIKIIGQVFDTYWIMEFEQNMYIVDQHAAHEKVLFERFMKTYRENKVKMQYLSPPVIFSVTLEEEEILKENLDNFAGMGFEIESFGGNEYALSGIPSDFSEAEPKNLLTEILDDIADASHKNTPETIKDRIATMACKAAVKGNNKLSPAEAEALLRKLMELENPYNCPHGRPTMITMSKYELEKKFKRIV